MSKSTYWIEIRHFALTDDKWIELRDYDGAGIAI